MKKDALLFLFAGFVLGSVVTFIVMNSLEKKPADAHAHSEQKASTKAPQGQEPGTPPENMDPEQHSSMMAEFIKQAKEDPNNIESKITLGNIYYDRGKYAEAIVWYEDALRLDPKNTDVIVDLGVCYREKDPAKAMEMFDRALAIDPKKQQALFNKVIVSLFDMNDIPGAKKNLAKLEAEYPNLPMAAKLKEEIAKAEKEPAKAK